MKRFFPVVIRRSTRIILNKAVCLNLALVMLFNLTSPVFAAATQNKQEEEKLLQELNQELQAQYIKNTASPLDNYLNLCLKNSDKNACDRYVTEVNKMFTDTADETAKGKEVKEEVFKPLSQKTFIKDLTENTKKEVEDNSLAITQEYNKQKSLLEQQYKGVGVNSPEYSSYIFAKSSLDNWQKENLKSLTDWQQEILENSDTHYQIYLEEFEKNVQEYKQDKENALNEYLKELANDTMAAYQNASDKSKLKFVPVFVYLLSMESPKAKLLTSAQRSEIYKFFNKVISPSNKTNPCRLQTRQRNTNELGAYKAWQDKLNRMEEETRGSLSARDQVAAQTRGYEQRVSADLQAPITELADEGACKAALSAVTGLSYFKGWDMSSVAMLMMKNATEPMASQVLLVGTQTLIETNRLDSLMTLAQYMVDMEATYEKQDDLRLKEAIFFDNKFYKTPYATSRYSEQDGGGDVWQDMAEMLAKDKTIGSKQVQQKILDRAVSFSIGNGKLRFNHNLPFVYGLILHNPQVIDTFVPSSAVAFSYDKYTYRGNNVYFHYNDEDIEVYIKEDGKAPFYLSDSAEIEHMVDKVRRKVGDVRKETLQRHKAELAGKREAYFKYFKEKRKGLKPSAVFAEEFYKADFIDLTVDEKLAMDKALEKKYSHLKKIHFDHKQKLEKNRIRANRLSGAITMIDIGLTLWFAADIYKGIKWSIKGVKAVRDLFKAGRAVKGLSDAKRVAFLKTFAKKNPNAVKLNRKLNRVKTMPQRMVNNLPKYKAKIKEYKVNTESLLTNYGGTPGGMVYSQRMANPAGIQGFYAKKYVSATAKAAKAVAPIDIAQKDTWWTRLRGKAGKPKEYHSIEFNNEGILEIDGDLFKTYKATMDIEDISAYNALIDKTIANLEKELELNKDRISFLAREYNKADALSEAELLEYEKFRDMAENLENLKERRFVTFRFNDVKKLSIKEKWGMHEKGHVVLPMYDAQGEIVSQVALDKALKATQDLTNKVKAGQKIVLKDGKIYLGEDILNVTIGAPKATITLLGKSGAKVEDLSFLSLREKKDKMWSLYLNNALTFSAASTSLNLSLAKAPFSIPKEEGNRYYVSQGLNMGLSVAIPYLFSFLSPMAAPLVKRYGASRMQVASLGIAGVGMSYAWFGGYNGFATKKHDEKGKLVYDENGKTIIADKAPSYWPLIIASLASGISSSLTRASLNIAINRYQISKSTMTKSMLAKNFGSLFMTVIPAGADLAIGHKDNLDFSISYPFLAGLSVIGAGLMLRNIPSSVAKESKYLLMPNKKRIPEGVRWRDLSLAQKWDLRPRFSDWADLSRESIKSFSLVNPFAKTKTIMPYYLSFMSFGATESYSYFKVFNSFTRDTVEDYTEGVKKSDGQNLFTSNDNKFFASAIATIPSFIVRWKFARKDNFSKGILHNILFTTAGISLLMMPSENLSKNENLALGIASGCLIGAGTANMYQYLQKLMLKDIVTDMRLVRQYKKVSALKTTAQSAYAGANIGLAIPIAYSKGFAERYKKDEVDGQHSADFKANQRVLPIALTVYGLGIIPLFRTPFKADIVTPFTTKVSKNSPYITVPFGINAVNNLFFRTNSKQEPITMPYTPKVNTTIPSMDIDLGLPKPKLNFEPIKYEGLTPIQTTQQSVEEETSVEEE